MAAFEQALWEAQDGKCFVCGKPIAAVKKDGRLGRDVNREHVTPKSLGGSLGYPNLALSHRACNEAKRNLPPTEDQLARLAEINARLTRQHLVDGAASEIHLLHNPRITGQLPGAGRIRARAVEFLASTLPQLSREEMIAAFHGAGAYGLSSPPASATLAEPTKGAPAMTQPVTPAPQHVRVLRPDPLDFHAPGDVEQPTVARPRLLAALLGVVGLAATLAAAAPMLGFLQQLPVLDAAWIAPGLLAAAILVAFADNRRIWGAALVLLLAALVAAAGVTGFDLTARGAFNDMMEGNGLGFRLAGYASPLALGGLILAALGWLGLLVSSLAARAPANA